LNLLVGWFLCLWEDQLFYQFLKWVFHNIVFSGWVVFADSRTALWTKT
jgi:hypothetical protein